MGDDLLPQEARSKSGWNWSSWSTSAFSALSELQKAAAGAADELSKNAIAAAKGVAELQHSVAESFLPEADIEDTSKYTENTATYEDGNDGTTDYEKEEKIRKTALEKLEAASKDSVISHGLKLLDDSMENITAGAMHALGSAWQGGITLIQRLENSAESIAEAVQSDEISVKAGTFAPNLIKSGKEFTIKGLKALENVGRETMDILALETRIGFDSSKLDLRGTNESSYLEEATFDRCFYIYGGPEYLEELEALSNHHALLCNRAKVKMTGDHKANFEGLIKQLQQVLMLNEDTSLEIDNHKGKMVEEGLLNDRNETTKLRDSSVAKAAEMAAGFTATLSGLPLSEVVEKTADRLEAIRAEGVHRLSELCAICISNILSLSKLVLAAGSGADTFWPNDCIGKAVLVRYEAKAMVSDIRAVYESFLTGIGDVTSAFQASMKRVPKDEEGDIRGGLLGQNSIVEKANSFKSGLESDGNVAIGKVQDGLCQVLQIILSTSLSI